ncbi:MAG: shikimate kinase [Anaerolineae bacterium]
MGTGKTTIGKLIATRLGWTFADTDQVIEQRQGKSVREIFAELGEPAFRTMESILCAEIGASWERSVIATGGGMVLNPTNREMLSNAGLLICFDAAPQVLAGRLDRHSSDRPLLTRPQGMSLAARIEELLTQRAEAYQAVKHHLDTGTQTPFAVVDQVVDLWLKG